MEIADWFLSLPDHPLMEMLVTTSYLRREDLLIISKIRLPEVDMDLAMRGLQIKSESDGKGTMGTSEIFQQVKYLLNLYGRIRILSLFIMEILSYPWDHL